MRPHISIAALAILASACHAAPIRDAEPPRASAVPHEVASVEHLESAPAIDPGDGAALGALLNPPPAPSGEPAPAAVPLTSAWSADTTPSQRSAILLTEAQRLAAARVLCESEPAKGSGTHFECAACPSYTELPTSVSMSIDFYAGHFSSPGSVELVAATSGCETGAGSFQSYGSVALLRLGANGWQRTLFEPGAIGKCTPLTSGRGRSRLVCRIDSGHMGVYEEAIQLVSFDASKPALQSGGASPSAGEPRGLPVIATQEDEEPRIARASILTIMSHDVETIRSTVRTGALVDPHIVRFALSGVDAYQRGDDGALSVTATVENHVDCAGGPSACPFVDTRTLDYGLRFVFDGSAFHVSDDTRAAYEALGPDVIAE